jgi:hypothetical protein
MVFHKIIKVISKNKFGVRAKFDFVNWDILLTKKWLITLFLVIIKAKLKTRNVLRTRLTEVGTET